MMHPVNLAASIVLLEQVTKGREQHIKYPLKGRQRRRGRQPAIWRAIVSYRGFLVSRFFRNASTYQDMMIGQAQKVPCRPCRGFRSLPPVSEACIRRKNPHEGRLNPAKPQPAPATGLPQTAPAGTVADAVAAANGAITAPSLQ